MNRNAIRFFQTVIAGLDLVAINLVVFLAHILLDTYIPPGYMTYYFRFWLFFNTVWLLLSWLFSVYNEYTIVSFEVLSRKTMKAYLTCVAIVIAYLFFFRQFELSRLFVLTVLPAVGLFLFINRIIYLLFRHMLHKRTSMDRKIIILGYNEVAKKLASYLEGNLNTRIVGFCAEQGQVTELSHYPIVGNLHNVMRLVEKLGINEIYTTIGPEQDRFIYNVIQEADQQCIRFRIIPDFSFFINQTVHIDYLRDMPVLSLRSEPLESLSSRLRKRFFDVVVSALITVFVLSWLIPLISLLIWLESKGPVFFVQQRSGKNNRTFYCIKFRSMRVNKDANLRQAKRNDDRLTRVGKFLRRTNLDEFPQFINVLKGEMSIVGPRPHMLRHTEDYSKILSQYMIRQFLKPGITGWAQVNGFRGEINNEEQLRRRIEHDIWYLENWSLWLDIKVIFLTAFKSIQGDKNAF